MVRLTAKTSYLINRIPGQTYLLLAIIIFAAANSITRKVTEIGAQNLITAGTPFHFVMFYL